MKAHPGTNILYWILKINIDSVTGPLTYKEFVDLKSKWKVDPFLIMTIGKDSVATN
jgi:hypothetical protein